MEKNKYVKNIDTLTEREREDEIIRLEREREKLTVEIEETIASYAKAIGSKAPVKGARKIGRRPNDWSFWHK